jgi:hypothetical protein
MTSLTSCEDFQFEMIIRRISHFQDGRPFQLNPLVSLLVDSKAWNEIYK